MSVNELLGQVRRQARALRALCRRQEDCSPCAYEAMQVLPLLFDALDEGCRVLKRGGAACESALLLAQKLAQGAADEELFVNRLLDTTEAERGEKALSLVPQVYCALQAAEVVRAACMSARSDLPLRVLAADGSSEEKSRLMARHDLSEAQWTQLLRRGAETEAAATARVREGIQALRCMGGCRWQQVTERVSPARSVLQADPYYVRADEATRAWVGMRIGRMAGRCGTTERKAAEAALALCRGREAPENCTAYWCGPRGEGQLARALGKTTLPSSRKGRLLFGGAAALCLLGAAPVYALFRGFGAVSFRGGLSIALVLCIPMLGTAMRWMWRGLGTSHMHLPAMAESMPPEETLVVIPALVTGPEQAERLLEQLEVHHLAEKQRAFRYLLLGDLKDARREETAEDGAILRASRQKLQLLQQKYGTERMYYVYRKRSYARRQGKWMGHERKRGALEQLNAFLLGEQAEWLAVGGEVESLRGIRYVMTVDADTRLMPGCVTRLVHTAMHPANLPRVEGGRVVSGYGLLEPDLRLIPRDRGDTLFSRFWHGEGGADPYAGGAEMYMDLFGRAIYTGKGLYDVRVFHSVLAGAIPEDRVLSHDLLEGGYVSCGRVNGTAALDDTPDSWTGWLQRGHRWIRGDWQLAAWLLPRVRTKDGHRVKNPLSLLTRWQIADNLRRSLCPAALLVACAVAMAVQPLLLVIPLFFCVEPALTALACEWANAACLNKSPALFRLQGLLRGLGDFLLLPVTAGCQLDGAVRGLVRGIRRRRTLEWKTAAQTSQGAAVPGLFTAVGTVAALWLLMPNGFPLWCAWLAAPALAFALSHRPAVKRELPLWVGRTVRASYNYFTVLVHEGTHYLPPDNWQQEPYRGSAMRTSPTNIGLMLLSHASAAALGWTGVEDALERMEAAMDAVDKLPKWHGHLYNWYDIADLTVLPPAYVSTVDCGNYAACLLAAASEVSGWAAQKLPGEQWLRGLREGEAHVPQRVADRDWESVLTAARRRQGEGGVQAGRLLAALNTLCPLRQAAQRCPALLQTPTPAYREAGVLAQQMCDACYEPCAPFEVGRVPELAEALMDKLAAIRRADIRHMEAVAWAREILSLSQSSRKQREAWCLRVEELVQRMQAAAWGGDFSRLYDGKAQLFYIGADGAADRAEGAHYDLLASEARLAGYMAVAKGDVPPRHFQHLGRPVVRSGGCALVSWSGTMFEYFLPRLLLQERADTLLGQTAASVLRFQRRFARQKGMPWGVSESGWYEFDRELNYQYRAFGIPLLAAQAEQGQKVAAPYALLLALPLQPQKAAAALKTLLARDMVGPFGPREALDLRGVPAPVKSHMAHHTGMGIAAYANCRLQDVWNRHFHAIAHIRAMEPLLWQQPAREGRKPLPTLHPRKSGPAARGLTLKGTEPMAWLMRGGGISCAMDTAGHGVSRFEGCDLNRFRAEPVGSQWGFFVYVRCGDTVFTPTPMPVGTKGRGTVRFMPGTVRFSRRAAELDAALDIACVPDEAAQVYRLQLHNRSLKPREVTVYAYTDICMAPREQDSAHPAFGGLFVETQAWPFGYLARRRPRGEEAALMLALAGWGGENAGGTTDRCEALGRGRGVEDPRFLREPVRERTGTVTDPCFFMARTLRLAPGEKGELGFVLAAGLDEDPRPVARALACGAETALALVRAGLVGQAQMRYLKLAGREHAFAKACRALLTPVQKGGVPREKLWELGLSADKPLMLITEEELYLFEALRYMGLDCEAAVTGSGGYRDDLPPGTVRAEADRQELLTSCAAYISGRRLPPREELPPFKPSVTGASYPLLPPPAEEPANGFGCFTETGYEIALPPGKHTPAPWSNVLANGVMGCVITERMGGWTWYENAREYKLTPYSGDAVRDPQGEALYVRDEETGEYWSAAPGPVVSGYPYAVEHRPGATAFRMQGCGLSQQLDVWIPTDRAVKYYRLRVTNRTDRARQLSAVMLVKWVLGSDGVTDAQGVTTSFGPRGSLWAENVRCAFPGGACLSAAGTAVHRSACGAAFIGERGTASAPAAMSAARLPEGEQRDELPAGILQAFLFLPPGGSGEVTFALSVAGDAQTAASLPEPRMAAESLQQTLAYWQRRLGQLVYATPDAQLDRFAHRLPYQVTASRLWGRAGLYQPGGAYGFRDQLQDCLALLFTDEETVRRRILDAASHQYREGDVQHWWHPPRRGLRSRCTDDRLFLPYVALAYCRVYGDDLWDREAAFLDSPPLKPGERDRYETPRVSGGAPLWMHALLALDAVRFGSHGLPLMGHGDWNDGMDKVGADGKGESVWLGFFVYRVAAEFLPVLRRYDSARAAVWTEQLKRLRHALDVHAWDGGWYRRAYYGDGTPLGSAQSEEGRIDSLSQSWAVLSGAADGDKARLAMENAWQALWDPAVGICRLLDPPFSKDRRPGYIAGYLPGIRENGGQYTHAAAWMALAWCALGEGGRAYELLKAMDPAQHTQSYRDALTYRTEPYAVAADVYGGQLAGRGGWTWYTGSAAWLQVAVLWGILGLRVDHGKVWLQPALPSWWREASFTWRAANFTLKCVIRVSSRPGQLLMDGQPQPDGRAALPESGEHTLELRLNRAGL